MLAASRRVWRCLSPRRFSAAAAATDKRPFVALQDFGHGRSKQCVVVTPSGSVAATAAHEEDPDSVGLALQRHGGPLSEEERERWMQRPLGPADAVLRPAEFLRHYLLPHRFPDSVAPTYWGYARLFGAQAVFGSAASVLATQSMLYAVGLSAGTALPAAAALNWVLKDGLGQLGGVLFAAVISNQFDAECKRWRMISAYTFNAATVLECCSPAVPHLFLPLAAVANIMKNVAWLSAGCTKADIHRSMALEENLADVTVKGSAQNIAGGLLGMALGIGVSALVGPEVHAVLPAVLALSGLNTVANYLSLKHVALDHLNMQRAERLVLAHLDGADASPVTPAAMRFRETFLRAYRSPLDGSSALRMDAPLPEFLSHSPDRLPLLRAQFRDESFWLRVDGAASPPCVQLLIHAGATAAQTTRAFFAATAVRHALRSDSGGRGGDREDAVDAALRRTRAEFPGFERALLAAGWKLDHTLIEVVRNRITLTDGDAAAANIAPTDRPID